MWSQSCMQVMPNAVMLLSHNTVCTPVYTRDFNANTLCTLHQVEVYYNHMHFYMMCVHYS